MKTRKEQIIEIIRTELSKAFEMGLRQHPNDAENSEFYRPKIDLSITPRVADEIMALPIDIPSEEEIDKMADKEYLIFHIKDPRGKRDFAQLSMRGFLMEGFVRGYKEAIAEIIKRNVK